MVVIGDHEVFSKIEEIIAPKHTSLFVIGVQKYLSNPENVTNAVRYCDYYDDLLERIAKNIQLARRARVPVVFIQHTIKIQELNYLSPVTNTKVVGLSLYKPLLTCIEHSTNWEFCDEVKPTNSDYIVQKRRSSPFVGTDLQIWLGIHKIKSLVICGFHTEECILASAQSAISYDYYPVILKDCIYSWDEILHQDIMRYFSSRFDVIDSDMLRDTWNRNVNY